MPPEGLPREMASGKYDGIDVTDSWTEVTFTENRLVQLSFMVKKAQWQNQLGLRQQKLAKCLILNWD